MKHQIYFSHLTTDEEIKKLTKKYDVGIETIQFGIGYNLDKLEWAETDYRERMKDIMEISCFSVHGPFLDLNPASFDPLIEHVTMHRFEQTYQAAKNIGAERIVFHTGMIPSVHYVEGWSKQAALFWRRFLEKKDDSVQIHLENNYDRFYQPVLKVLEQVNHPAFTACLDVGHIYCYSEQTIREWFEGMNGRIGHLHLHDNDGTKDQHLAIGNGKINWTAVRELIEKCCPKAGITIENTSGEDLAKSFKIIQNW